MIYDIYTVKEDLFQKRLDVESKIAMFNKKKKNSLTRSLIYSVSQYVHPLAYVHFETRCTYLYKITIYIFLRDLATRSTLRGGSKDILERRHTKKKKKKKKINPILLSTSFE